MNDDQAWDHIMAIAKKHGMIFQAFAGTATLVHPETQKAEGIFEHCQKMNGVTQPAQTELFKESP